jgi:hypothetical protein
MAMEGCGKTVLRSDETKMETTAPRPLRGRGAFLPDFLLVGIQLDHTPHVAVRREEWFSNEATTESTAHV